MRYAQPKNKNASRSQTAPEPPKKEEDVVVAASLHENTNDKFNSVNHTAQMIRAALPHVGYRSQKSMNAILQATELIDTFQSLSKNDDVSAMALEDEKLDLEAMLVDMREVSVGQEKEMLDTMLNFVKARNLYNTYRTVSVASLNNSTGIGKMFGMDENANMMDILASFLTPEQKATFDNLSMIMSVMS